MGIIACALKLDGDHVDSSLSGSVVNRIRHSDGCPARSWTAKVITLSVIPTVLLPGEAPDLQPLSVDGIAVALDGRLDNRAELAPALREAGMADPDGASDAEVLIWSYQKWGADCVRHLVGDFAFLLWDASRQQLLAARDPMGMRTLYYRQVGHTLLLASSIRGLLLPDLPQVSLSTEYLMNFFREMGVVDAPATPWTGIYRLPKGHRILTGGGILRVDRFWDLRNVRPVRYRNKTEYSDEFFEHFSRAVQCRLRSATPVAVFMSGGLDSTSVFSMARHVSPDKQTVFPVSAVYDEFHDCDERAYIESVLHGIEGEACYVSGDGSWTFRELDHVPVMDEPWVNLASYHLQATLHRSALVRGARVVLSGYGGDQVLSGSLDRLASYLRRLQLRKLSRHMMALAELHRLPYPMIWREYVWGPVRGKTAEAAPDWGWLAPRWRQQLEAPLPGPPLSDLEPARRQRYLIINKALAVLANDEAVSRPMGMEMRHPFLDRRLVEFLFSIPDELRLDETLTQKAILRDAMRQLLPMKVLMRRGKTMSHSAIFQGIQREWSQVGEPLLGQSLLSQIGLADSNGLARTLGKFRMGSEQSETAWLAIILDAWLRRPQTGQAVWANPVR